MSEVRQADDHLMALVVRGDRDALRMLYDKYGRLVYSMARAMLPDSALAEEVTQDVFTTLWLKAEVYRQDRGRLYSWLMTITHNRALDELRRLRRVQQITLADEAGQHLQTLPSHRATETEALQALAHGKVRQALTLLPEEQRRIVVLAYFQGCSHTEIAALLGLPLGTVKTRMRLALQKLRSIMNAEQ